MTKATNAKPLTRRWENMASKLSAIAGPSMDSAEISAREKVYEAIREYYANRKSPTIIRPGIDPIPASSKVLDQKDLLSLVDGCLDMWLTEGRFADEFQRRLGKRLGAKPAKLTVSGSSANLLAFSSLLSPSLPNRIKPGDEVITVAAGFPTTVFPIIQNGCIPVFIDIEIGTYNVDVRLLNQALSSKTKAVMLAHTMGNPFNLKAVMDFCNENGLFLIEDCCDALGAEYDGKHVGTYGNLGTLSFYPAHHITTGEGGAVFGTDKKLLDIVQSYRDWGRDCYCAPGMNNTCGKRFDWEFDGLPDGFDHKFIYTHVGYNLKMTDIQASLGISQLEKLDGFIQNRQINHSYLDQLLRDMNMEKYIILPEKEVEATPSWFGYLITLRDSVSKSTRQILKELDNKKIVTRPLFAGNLIRQPAMREQNFRVSGSLNCTDMAMERTFWVGIYPGLMPTHLKYIAESLSNVILNPQ